MTAKVFTVAQQKGGAGKSTLAAHLAVCWSIQGKRVALVDIDPQGSLANWHAVREETMGAGETGLTFDQVTGWRTQRAVETLARDHDVVVIDSPPHAETEAKIAIRAADLVVVPSQPSPLDVWATVPTLEVAAKEKTQVVIALNRVPPRASLTGDMMARLKDYDVALAEAPVGNRVLFASAMAEGRTALEVRPSSTAAGEIRALADELFRIA